MSVRYFLISIVVILLAVLMFLVIDAVANVNTSSLVGNSNAVLPLVLHLKYGYV